MANGITQYVNNKNETLDGSVWKLSNFQRGNVIEEKFGGNLPEFYPVIDRYDKGKAVKIVSVNHISESYKKYDAFENRLKEEIDNLISFKGADYGGVNIKNKDIEFREIIFVFPEDDFTIDQNQVIKEIKNYGMKNGINVTIERYQRVIDT